MPTLASVSPTSGPAAGLTRLAITGTGFQIGAALAIGNVNVPATDFTVTASTRIDATSPALPAGTLNGVIVTNPDYSTATLPEGFFADFLDVPQAHAFHGFVEKLVRNKVTGGCGMGNYCPADPVTREQMAVSLLRSNDGPAYVPPPCSTPPFPDVPCSNPFARWIAELLARNVTAGCGGGNYCPADVVPRDQAAVFLLRTQGGPTHTPPGCTVQMFSDVPCSSPFAPWVNELASRGITAGCGVGLYCPRLAITRGQLALFLVKTFGIP